MSLQRLHLRRSAERPTHQTEKQHSSKRQSPHRPPGRKGRSTRRRRIWDLLRHTPTFLVRFSRLMAFVLFLLPAFAVFVWHYLTCDRVVAYYGKCPRCIVDEETEGGDSQVGTGTDQRNDEKTVPSTCNARSGGFHNCKRGHSYDDPFFSRHYLDIYGSRTPSPGETSQNKKPAVIFLTGGAWIIGYRMWGTLLGRALAPFGVLVIVPDYRNFPRVNIEGMVNDVDMSIQWVFDHVEQYGGDKEKVVLVGQSAGAHIGGVIVATKVLEWLRREMQSIQSTIASKNEEGDLSKNGAGAETMSPLLESDYLPQQLRGFISTSSPHNLVSMRTVFHHHGLSADMQKSIFGGVCEDQSGDNAEDVFEKWSPYHLVLKARAEYVKLMQASDGMCNAGLELKDVFPNMCVIHGTADKTVPVNEAHGFISLLAKLQIPTVAKMYKGWTHTDPILEKPMRGNHTYHRDVYELVSLWTNSGPCPQNGRGKSESHGSGWKKPRFDESHPILRAICPSVLVEAARSANPF